jgi:sugar lactone lactonase YvrE
MGFVPEIEVLTPALTTIGESALWDVETERLWWIDIFGHAIFRGTAEGRELRVWSLPCRPSSFALRADGDRAIITSGSRISFLDLETTELEVVFDADVERAGFNDGKVDRQGRFVTGLADHDLMEPAAFDRVGTTEPRGRLYRVDGDRTSHELGQPIGMSNGPCFSPDGTTLYWGDSWSRVVHAFDYEPATGEATNPRVLVHFHGDSPAGVTAVPDGATVDAEGGIWVAACYGSEIRRYAPDGTLDRRLPVPVVSPTSVAFGGPDLDTLFVTSIGDATLPGGLHRSGPLAGTILAVHGLGVRGIPETRFAG